MKDEVWEDLGEPICIVTKFTEELPEYKGVFSPTITLNITLREELSELECSDFNEVMEMSELGVSMILKDFKIIKRYEPYMMSGSEFFEYDAEYLFEHVDISEPLKVELKTLKTKHNGFYYDFNCHQSYSQSQIADREFAEFKESIKLI